VVLVVDLVDQVDGAASKVQAVVQALMAKVDRVGPGVVVKVVRAVLAALVEGLQSKDPEARDVLQPRPGFHYFSPSRRPNSDPVGTFVQNQSASPVESREALFLCRDQGV
jgi:hypothetical protein